MERNRKRNQTTSGDPIILKQKLIHLQSELAQYVQKLKEYQHNYHYSLIDQLKAENNLLQEQLEDYKKKISTLEEALQKTQNSEALIEQLQEELQNQGERNQQLSKECEEKDNLVIQLQQQLEDEREIGRREQEEENVQKESWFFRNIRETKLGQGRNQINIKKDEPLSVFLKPNHNKKGERE
ncbi:hypothetical protein [Bacillus alkalicellulosilyticus]|uniref:hypothetical protein n=1 Tax=Alkalihalobacterium alkalicellulosilyticum TaxID=1912214 RepID=UPI0009967921|nr:hypothetical protein [Bacillus alkalicellulosilyticus]